MSPPGDKMTPWRAKGPWVTMIMFFSMIMLGLISPMVTGQSRVGPVTPQDAALGRWLNSDGVTIVEVFKRADNRYYGRILWVRGRAGAPPGHVPRDTRNPDPALKGRPLVGIENPVGFVYNPAMARWDKGRIYDFRTGRTFEGHMSLKTPDRILVRGYYRTPALGMTQTWTRLPEGTPIPPPAVTALPRDKGQDAKSREEAGE